MESITESTLLDALEQLASACPEFAGAVVATRDGLVLATLGDYQGDAPAACAASLSVHLQDDLQPLDADSRAPGVKEVLVFGDHMLWYLSHLATGHLLLIGSRQTPHVGALRLAGQTAAARLNRWLAGPERPD